MRKILAARSSIAIEMNCLQAALAVALRVPRPSRPIIPTLKGCFSIS